MCNLEKLDIFASHLLLSDNSMCICHFCRAENNFSLCRKIGCPELKLCSNSNGNVCILSTDDYSCERNKFLIGIFIYNVLLCFSSEYSSFILAFCAGCNLICLGVFWSVLICEMEGCV